MKRNVRSVNFDAIGIQSMKNIP
ncbi:MAG: hypothetical protein QOD99_1015, partial [Chthoniobacter sp.]|nr:hypothetical protein [Chthoniobacter sp.]